MRTGLLSTQVAPRACTRVAASGFASAASTTTLASRAVANRPSRSSPSSSRACDHDDGAPQHKLRLNQQDPGQQRGHSSPSFPARVSFAKRRSASRMDSSTGPKVRGTVSFTQSVPMWCPLGALSGAPA